MLRDKELKWFYQDGASRIFPEAWEGFLKPIKEEDRNDLMDAYYKIFTGDDDKKKMEAAVAWSKWEGSVSTLSHKPDMISSYSESKFALAFALIENHYFVNKGFLDNEDQLISSSSIDKIRHIPAKIIQGRYDIVCPMETAWELSKNWPEDDETQTEGRGNRTNICVITGKKRRRHNEDDGIHTKARDVENLTKWKNGEDNYSWPKEDTYQQ